MLERNFATNHLPGVGGRFKVDAADFEVTEVPLYAADGEGEHLYLHLRRRDMNTRDLVRRVSRLSGFNEREIGYAGLKDRNAIATQTLSVAMPPEREASFVDALKADDKLEVLAVTRHRNKLKRGHLLGNHFKIRLREVHADSVARAEAILAVLQAQGLPNFFGEQRYGRDGQNADSGAAIIGGRRERDRFLRELYLHAWQSRRFDQWLAKRLELGNWNDVVAGDLARVEGSGGLFRVEDLEAERRRAEAGEISATGPMIGAKMMPAMDLALSIEVAAGAQDEVDLEQLRRLRLQGSRRVARVFPKDVAIAAEADQSLLLSFFLPKGSYATNLLAEVMKTESIELGDGASRID